MDFKLTEEQQMLQDTAARLVRDAYPFEQREKYRESEQGFSVDFWNQLGELGLTAVPFAEDWTCGIRLGDGDWPGFVAEPLFAADLLPVCAPSAAGRLRKPEDLRRASEHAQRR